MHLERRYQEWKYGKTRITSYINELIKERDNKKRCMPELKCMYDWQDKEIAYLWEQYAKGKRRLIDIEDMVEVYDFDDLYEDITNQFTPEQKKQYLINNLPVKVDYWNKVGKCMHCGKFYLYNDSRIIKDKNTGFEYISCKYPDCDGTVIDFIVRD